MYCEPMNKSNKDRTGIYSLFAVQRFFVPLVFLFGFSPVSSNVLDSLILNGYGQIDTRVFITADKSLNADILLDSVFFSAFTELPYRKTLSPQKYYWYKLDFDDINLEDSKEWIIRFPKYDRIILYSKKNDSLHAQTNGRMELKGEDGPYHAVDFNISSDELIEGRYLLARIQHVFRKTSFGPALYLNPVIAELDKTYFTQEDLFNYIPYFLFIGGMLLMIFYSFGIYFMNRDKLFNYYAIYLLSLVLYLGVRLPLFFGMLELRERKGSCHRRIGTRSSFYTKK